MLAESSQTNGLAIVDSSAIGNATKEAIDSGASSASRFGTSSPTTMLK